MLDLVYIAGSIAVFALLLAYVAGCERLGRSAAPDSPANEVRS